MKWIACQLLSLNSTRVCTGIGIFGINRFKEACRRQRGERMGTSYMAGILVFDMVD